MKVENWIKWDLDSRNGWKMASFFSEYGAVGYGIFVVLIEHLYRAKDNKLPIDTKSYKSYTNLFKVEQDQFISILDSLTTCGLLEKDENFLWSPRVNEEIKARNEKSEELSKKRQLAVNIRWNRQNQQDSQSPDIQTDTNVIQNDTKHTRLDKNRLDKNIYNNKKTPIKCSDFTFPELLNRDICIKAFNAWIEHRNEIKKPLTKQAGKLLLQKYKDRAGDFIRDIKHSIMGGYQGVFPPKVDPPKFQPNESKQELNRNQTQLLERVKLKEPLPIGKVLAGALKKNV